MNGKEISIKKAMEQIEVPEDRLDLIIENAFLETAPPKAKKRRKWLVPAVAASVLFVGISTAILTASPAFANYMAELPVIGNVFSIFAEEEDEEGLLQYERFSEKVELSQTSNGVTISIDQAVYDGTNVTFTYTVTADRELDDSARLTGFPRLLEAEGVNASMDWELAEGGLVGMNTIPHLNEEAAQVNVLWEPASLYTDDGEIEGDWKFEFAVDQLKKDPIALDEKVTESGVTVHFTEVTFTDIAVNIAYQQLVDPVLLEEWEAVEAELIAQDNLGNVYKVPYNGGTAYEGAITREDLFWTATMRGLDPLATTLTFYPFAHVSRVLDGKNPEWNRIEFDALEINMLEGTYRIIQDPVFPVFEEEEEEEGK
ncbi:DUF4179 domain-containing protein [Planococcus shenhongbingii]|uniref:DUF4179 domain-containing protein n=1 Tax=Planococcus shenhongbingii TaxID=3058398 RepID=A0ABT8N7P4_9BACL|nr:DUF4179 domain-containing protein [Planococcus sp. N017]MDN7243898.1 DUF4179 domain-containing protein [Planococcus sp. N017]